MGVGAPPRLPSRTLHTPSELTRNGLVTHSRLSDFRPPEVSDFHPALTMVPHRLRVSTLRGGPEVGQRGSIITRPLPGFRDLDLAPRAGRIARGGRRHPA